MRAAQNGTFPRGNPFTRKCPKARRSKTGARPSESVFIRVHLWFFLLGLTNCFSLVNHTVKFKSMKLHIILLAATMLAVSAQAQDKPDAFMGDWQGSVSIGAQTQVVSVYMIPLDQGNYEARMVGSFSERGPYLFRLRGMIRNDQFRFLDDVPLNASQVAGITEKGVVFAASLWSGNLTGDSVQGSVTGRQTGSFELRKTKRVSPDLGQRPPAGALILLDGSNLAQWHKRDSANPIGWKLLTNGVMEVAGGGDIVSKEQFGDHQLHVEFRLPYMPGSFGQGRANSGVYVQSRYEIQVLDSYGLEGFDNECGGFYQIKGPVVNMCAPPLQWQSYDVVFHSAKRDANGKKSANARITVVHNGVVIHDDFELPHATPGSVNEKEGEPAGLLLQDHGNPVQYRNIWVKRL